MKQIESELSIKIEKIHAGAELEKERINSTFQLESEKTRAEIEKLRSELIEKMYRNYSLCREEPAIPGEKMVNSLIFKENKGESLRKQILQPIDLKRKKPSPGITGEEPC